MQVLPVTPGAAVTAGRPDPRNADYVITQLKLAADGCLDGTFSAMVTAPVNKAVICEGGIAFSGHTQWLAERAGTSRVVMMLVCEGLRVALATTHLPLAQVPGAITRELITSTLAIVHRELAVREGIVSPHILVCGLNPHAGEQGHLGHEEQEVIAPALAYCRAQGMHLTGPLPADTAFVPRILKDADAVLAMYHDQGLPVLKHKGFGQAVNVTLNLPFIRTSVDHGTATALAGTGQASPHSLQQAVCHAVRLVRQMAARNPA